MKVSDSELLSASAERGSLWRNWDLHVHTPESIVQNYGGSGGWPRFMDELEQLPVGSVIGVNDYLFVDGYERIVMERSQGRLTNLAAIFPVVELRLTALVGTKGHLQKVNFHVIFSNELSADEIRGQFLGALASKVRLNPENPAEVTWSGVINREAVTEFGARLRASVPARRQREFNESNLELGFNGLTFDLDQIHAALNHTALKGRYLTAVGKAEWDAMQWNDQSIATKKTTLNSSEIVFTACETAEQWATGRQKLVDAGVNSRLFHCSDAHSFADAEVSERLGRSLTWMNVDPTMVGLRHCVTEYDHRVFVGNEPEPVAALNLRPSSYMKSIQIQSKDGRSGSHDFFDIKLELNPGFIAVVGNKGQGKSALLDVLGLLGGSTNEEHFSFLSAKRFREQRKNPAAEYEAILEWWGGAIGSAVCLSAGPSAHSTERVTYLPQRLIEAICSADPEAVEAQRFSAEIQKVLFLHVPEEHRLGCNSLRDLLDKRTQPIESRIAILRAELADINAKIVALQTRWHTRSHVKDLLVAAENQLRAHKEEEPPPPSLTSGPEDDAIQQIESEAADLRDLVLQLQLERDSARSERDALNEKIALAENVREALTTVRSQAERAIAELVEPVRELGLEMDALVEVAVNLAPLVSLMAQLDAELAAKRKSIGSPLDDESLEGRIHAAKGSLLAKEAELEAPSKAYAAARKVHTDWKNAHELLAIGDANSPGVRLLTARLAEIDALPVELEEMRSLRRAKAGAIYDELDELLRLYAELHLPASDFIDGDELASLAGLEFSVSLRERGLSARFFDIHMQNRSGNFYGATESQERLEKLVASTELSSRLEVLDFVDELERLTRESDNGGSPRRFDPSESVRTAQSLEGLYDLIFGLEYLRPSFELRQNGQALDELSPGEKGTLLVLFYLLVDPSERPLLLDQPDENLDNRTIKEMLVPALKKASRRRQVVVVTHNPNVAVVADADQVVVAEKIDEQFYYSAGTIENESINSHIVDILEGTWPAYENRGLKYVQEPVPVASQSS